MALDTSKLTTGENMGRRNIASDRAFCFQPKTVDFFSYFSMKAYVVVLTDAFQMSAHSIMFSWRNKKNI